MTDERPAEEAGPELMVERAAQRRAEMTLARAVVRPEELAAENAQLRSAIRGTHGLLNALVKRYGGTQDAPILVERAAHQSVDPGEELKVDVLPNGDVHLYIRPVVQNREARRAAKRGRR